MVITQNRRDAVFHGVIGHKLSSGRVTAALVLLLVRLVHQWFRWFWPITCNSNPRLQQLKSISITASTSGPFEPDHKV